MANERKWYLDLKGCETSNGLPIIVKANGHLVAHLCERNEEAGKLMAAAPDLARALTIAVDYFDNNGGDRDYTWLPELKGALVKAGLRKAPGKRWYVSEVRRPDAGGLWNATLVDGTECNRTPTHSQAGAQAIADELNAIEARRA